MGVHLQTGMLFGITTESCSAPERNRVHLPPDSPRIEPMKKISRTLRAHRTLLLNYFKARKQFSSGVIEGLNNKAKVTMRRSYGFRTFRILELALYHSLGKLPQPELTHEFF
jgi:hypothetical protein